MTNVVSEQVSTGVTACITVLGGAVPQVADDTEPAGLTPETVEVGKPPVTGWVPTAAQT